MAYIYVKCFCYFGCEDDFFENFLSYSLNVFPRRSQKTSMSFLVIPMAQAMLIYEWGYSEQCAPKPLNFIPQTVFSFPGVVDT